MSEEEAEEYYNKLWLENKELIQENIERLDKKRFALQLMLADKDREIERLQRQKEELQVNGLRQETLFKLEIERLNNIINELEKWLEEQHQFIIEIPAYTKEISIEHKTMELCYENILDKLQELKGSDKE